MDRSRRIVQVGLDEAGPSGQTEPSASARAARIAGAEKSRPTTSAPRCARVNVSRPKWHCRWSTRRPASGGSSALLDRVQAPRARAVGGEVVAPAAGRIGTRSSQFARLTVRQSSSSSSHRPPLVPEHRIGTAPLQVNAVPRRPRARRCGHGAGDRGDDLGLGSGA